MDKRHHGCSQQDVRLDYSHEKEGALTGALFLLMRIMVKDG
jgi:hypothetical protein